MQCPECVAILVLLRKMSDVLWDEKPIMSEVVQQLRYENGRARAVK
jgi:hypothetical protein